MNHRTACVAEILKSPVSSEMTDHCCLSSIHRDTTEAILWSKTTSCHMLPPARFSGWLSQKAKRIHVCARFGEQLHDAQILGVFLWQPTRKPVYYYCTAWLLSMTSSLKCKTTGNFMLARSITWSPCSLPYNWHMAPLYKVHLPICSSLTHGTSL